MRVTESKKNPKLYEIKTEINETSSVLNVFILDASGSMTGSKYLSAIDGINSILSDIRLETIVTNKLKIVEFEGSNISTRLDFDDTFPNLYIGMGCRGTTPLNDAIGLTIEDILNYIKINNLKNTKVLISIFTDGGENSSTSKYRNPTTLSKLLKDCESKGFTITFIGREEEVNYATNILNLSSNNVLVHDNTSLGITASYDTTRSARIAYAKSVADGDINLNFYIKK